MAAESPIAKQIREVLGTSLRRDASTIKPEHSLRDDLGLDSLMTFELLYDLEKEFDLEIPNDDLPGLQTLADVTTYLEKRMKEATKTSAPKAKEKKPALPKQSKTEKAPAVSKRQTAKREPAKRQPAKPAAAKKAPAKAKNSTTPAKSRSIGTATNRVASTPTPKTRTTTPKPKAKKK